MTRPADRQPGHGGGARAHIGPSANLSVSAGVATSPRSLDELDHLVQRADSHLMQAKRDGRDRVICDAV